MGLREYPKTRALLLALKTVTWTMSVRSFWRLRENFTIARKSWNLRMKRVRGWSYRKYAARRNFYLRTANQTRNSQLHCCRQGIRNWPAINRLNPKFQKSLRRSLKFYQTISSKTRFLRPEAQSRRKQVFLTSSRGTIDLWIFWQRRH